MTDNDGNSDSPKTAERGAAVSPGEIFDQYLRLRRRTLDGDLEPAVFRAVAQADRWYLAKADPARFGDKAELRHTGKITLAQLLAETGKDGQ